MEVYFERGTGDGGMGRLTEVSPTVPPPRRVDERIPSVRAVLFSCAVLAASTALADGNGHVDFFVGQKALDADWDPIDRQGQFGVVMSFGRDEWPIHIAADVLVSAKEGTLFGPIDVSGGTFEAAAGVRKIWGQKAFHPYAGAGIAIVGAGIELSSPVGDADDSDATIGPWVGGGIFWRLGTRFDIGIDVRWSTGKVDLDFGGGVTAPDLDAGGLHYGLLLGFGW
jgi:hypothetical protein